MGHAYFLTFPPMTQAQFLSSIAALTQGAPLYSQENIADPRIRVKLFDIAGSATWYLTEYDSVSHIAFGYVTGLACDEWGTVSIDELMELRWHGIPRVEIDRHFAPTNFKCITGLA